MSSSAQRPSSRYQALRFLYSIPTHFLMCILAVISIAACTPAVPKTVLPATRWNPPPPSPELSSTASALQPVITTTLPAAFPSATDLSVADLPTQTRTPVPPAPVIGGADKIAFLSGHEIWAANLDGTDLVRLASGEEPKAHLQWAPDGEAVLFASTGCLYSAGLERRVVERIACFDPPAEITAFSISADGKQAAIGLDRELFLFPFDLPALKNAASRADLIALAACPYHAPLVFKGWPVAARQVRWSQDGQRLAVLRQAADSSRLVDEVHLLDISGCNGSIRPLDEFPATRFSMPDYTSRPVLQSFGWDGRDLFALYGFKRNDGFGDLWLYDSGQRLALQAQPVPGGCCYRDPHFSPDGEYLLFVYQDRANASQPVGQVYLVPVKAIGSGLIYPPLPVDARLLTDPRGKPQPVLRPAR